MIELPLSVLQTPLATVEPLDLETITDLISSETDPSRRHDDWHPDFPREDDRDGVGAATELTGWSSRQVRRISDGLVVGTIGFFGPPDDQDGEVPGEAEVGFGLVEDARGQGLMSEVLAVVLSMTDAVGVPVRAGTLAANAPSRAVLEKNGFVVRSEQTDDPEREVVLARAALG